ncbi:carbohydrate ABC transporter membrane protein 1, CUT1 family [Gracilibacillus orientalis]|uniref:ABC transporter permease subunit n=2 Tax=Gracilibacillus TaxID=74385 RepID=A0A5Q2TPK6_9BACI|nr:MULTISPECIES: sugar ABC transporter permease [Gracilibacillus]QGH36037.1 ABC transporter permease subunit [Gracilibacillus salitolerans]SFL46632.1 carbohydrate ABC transporter membrane protein 1, CUT1 family [Gracilibacillus orientalis]
MHNIKQKIKQNKTLDFIFSGKILFLLPAFALISIFVIYPLILAVGYSFTDYYLLKPNDISFVGFDNYMEIAYDKYAKKAFFNSAKYVIYIVPLQVILSLFLATLIAKKSKTNTLFRTAFFSPYILSIIVVSLLWKNILDPNSGIVNEFLASLGFAKQEFFSDPNLALPTISFIILWQGISFQMLILMAALQDIPSSLYEAASMEGANAWQKFKHITLPSIKGQVVFVLIVVTTGTFKIIIEPLVITNGGPQGSTSSILLYMFEQGTRYRQIGYASAITVIFAIILIMIAFVQRKLVKEEEG